MSRRLSLISFALLSAAALCGPTGDRARATEKRPAAAPTRASKKLQGDSLAIVVNRANPVENLSFAELREYFLAVRARWPNGRRVRIVMRQPGGPERDAVLRVIYEMREQDFHTHFLRAMFVGEVLEEPRTLDTAPRVLNFVFLQPGAVGYVRAAEVNPSVKVVRVDGLAPGDPDYKLTF